MWHNIADIYQRFKQLSIALLGIGICADADRRRSPSSRAHISNGVFCSFFKCSKNPFLNIYIYRMSQEEWTKLRESVPYVKIQVYRYNPKHLYPKLNGYGDNGQRSLKV